MKSLIGTIFILVSCSVLANEPLLVHQHSAKVVGVLPDPYKTFELEITLNSENDDVSTFTIKVGNKRISLDNEQLDKLKDVELGTMQVSHMLGYTPDLPPGNQSRDLMFVELEFGPRYRIEYQEKGETHYNWGKDLVTVQFAIDSGKIFIGKQKLNRFTLCRKTLSN